MYTKTHHEGLKVFSAIALEGENPFSTIVQYPSHEAGATIVQSVLADLGVTIYRLAHSTAPAPQL